MDHGKIERSKVLVEWEVRKVVVNVEEEGVVDVRRRLRIGDPVEFVYESMTEREVSKVARQRDDDFILIKTRKRIEILSNLLLMISIGLPNGATTLAGEPVFEEPVALGRIELVNFFCGGDRYDGSSMRAFSAAY